LIRPGAVTIQQCCRCAEEVWPLYIGVCGLADDKADAVLLDSYKEISICRHVDL